MTLVASDFWVSEAENNNNKTFHELISNKSLFSHNDRQFPLLSLELDFKHQCFWFWCVKSETQSSIFINHNKLLILCVKVTKKKCLAKKVENEARKKRDWKGFIVPRQTFCLSVVVMFWSKTFCCEISRLLISNERVNKKSNAMRIKWHKNYVDLATL